MSENTDTKAEPTELQINEVKALLTAHNQECIVVLAWTARADAAGADTGADKVNLVTCGINQARSKDARDMGYRIALALGCEPDELKELLPE
jgi:hypothetical protein